MLSYKPNIVVSRCFFEPVRYNGKRISNSFIDSLKGYVNFIRVCPELEVGLGVPRLPVRLMRKGKQVHMIQQETEGDITWEMLNFASKFLAELKDIDGFILKSKSPSCGIASVKIYDAVERKTAIRRGKGIFAAEVKKKFVSLPIASEGSVMDPAAREKFLTAIFELSELRNRKSEIALPE